MADDNGSYGSHVEKSYKDHVLVEVVGRPGYLRWTLVQWLHYIRDIVEGEYRVRLDIKVVDSDNEHPVLRIEGSDVLVGLPGEEGYLIEVLKKKIEELGYRTTGSP